MLLALPVAGSLVPELFALERGIKSSFNETLMMNGAGYSTTSCEHCGGHIEFPVEGAGMKVACPHCSQETVLLETCAVPAVRAEEITAAELTAALQGVLPPNRISLFYQAGLLLVALFMVLLPLAYLAFAAGSAYGVYWYAFHATAIFSGPMVSVHVVILKVILYLGPLVGGIVAVFFMFKPILARPARHAQPLELNPAQLPRLYQFIAHISDLVHAPMPKRIYLDCELNASAGLRRGWWSFLGSDLALNIGLPLAAGLNTQQLAALVAHEMGHCSQGLAMRLRYVINRIDGWFVRVVYERDTWDEAFEEWSNSIEDTRLSLIVACAHLAVWFSRKVLTLLMMAGHAASCFLSRQMEFHADRGAMAVAGSAGLESLLLRVRELSLLERLAYNGLRQFWTKRHQLPDSLPDFLEQLERRVPPNFHEQAQHTLLNETAGLFDTHPTSAQRIQKARQRAEPGIFRLDKPARRLFSDFTAVAQSVTGRHYRQNLRLAVTPPMLKPVQAFFSDESSAASR